MADDQSTPPLPPEVAVLPLRRTVAFPLTLQPLAVNRPVSIEAVNRALGGDRLLLLVLQETRPTTRPPSAEAHRHRRRHPADGEARRGIHIIVEGIARVRADVDHAHRTSMRAQITPMPGARSSASLEVDAYVRRLQELIDRALSLATGLSQELRGLVAGIDDPLRLAYLLASLLDMKPEEKQQLLEQNDLLDEARGGRRPRSAARSRCSS